MKPAVPESPPARANGLADPGAVRSILVIHVSRIGDTLLATPALRAIAQAWPQARLTCLAHPKRREVLAGLPFIHHLGAITKDRARWQGHLFGRKFDLAFVFGHDAALVEYALRCARHVVAFRQGDPQLDARLWRVAELPPPRSVHAVDYLLALTDALAVPHAGAQLAWQVAPAEAAWARATLAPLATASPLVGVQIASFPTKAYRDWPLENFVALLRRLRQRAPRAHFLIFGGKLERARTQQLNTEFAECSTHCAGALTLRQTAALMAELDLYIGVDTGPTHIMGALQRPMVALYHGYSPSHLLAPREHPCLYVVDHPRAMAECTPDTPMGEIAVDTVWAQVERALAEHPPRRRSA